MSQQKLLKRVVDVLDSNGIEYMLTGSLVSSLQGDPRSTHDIDIVVVFTHASIPAMLQAFPPPRFYLDETSVREAIVRRGMFNLLDADTGDKVDFWLLTDEGFDQSRFARKTPANVGSFFVNISKPEDTILQKLKWAHDSGGSARQFGDARSVYEVQFHNVDQVYLDQWAQRLGVVDLLQKLRTEAQIP